ncbi:hypothetical protein WJX74_001133 [Apatococcus lobatus]|uniref:Sugar phosphate transporter domain-containing protein n=1 Tax=Apatococcus lobatus TaxID=904363 RepID=A0AAW1RCX6_9CHLO
MGVQLIKLTAYILLNVTSSTCIVFANKMVMTTYGFHFPYALMLLHASFNFCGINIASYMGLFPQKTVPRLKITPLAFAIVAFVCLTNLNLERQSVTFYQITKIAVPPVVIAIEASLFGKHVTLQTSCAVALVCFGVALATITDPEVVVTSTNAVIGVGSIISAAIFQILASRDQKALGLSSLQLLQEYSPQAAAMLSILVPFVERIGYLPANRTSDTLLGFAYTPENTMALIFSASCALIVVLSGFLVIGSTSALTYNIIGHTKTVLVLAGGSLMFGDKLTYQKVLGVSVALAGMGWYTFGNIITSDEKAAKAAMAPPRKSPESPTKTAVSPMKPPARQHLSSTE